MSFARELSACLRTRCGLIIVATREDQRAVDEIVELCRPSGRGCFFWDAADSFQWLTPADGTLPIARDALTALEQVEQWGEAAVIVLPDFLECCAEPAVRRKLKTLARQLEGTDRTLIVVADEPVVPEGLMDVATLLRLPLPGVDELGTVLDEVASRDGVACDLTPAGRGALLQAAEGLTLAQARRVFLRSATQDGAVSHRTLELVRGEMLRTAGRSEAISMCERSVRPESVAGMGLLKEWLVQRRRGLSPEARAYGLPKPRGIGLVGIAGTGKALVAAMVSSLWEVPLLRLDLGALFASPAGESDARVRRAVRAAEALAPCVLWVRDLESTVEHTDLDSGASGRVFSAVTRWIAEGTAPVFAVATVNDASWVEADLLQGGWLDDVFMIDLPHTAEREEILAIRLRHHGRDARDFDLERLGRETEGFVGGELERALADAMYHAFSDGGREVTTDDISRAAAGITPLSVAMEDALNAARAWLAEGRARPASALPTPYDERRSGPLQVDFRHPEGQ